MKLFCRKFGKGPPLIILHGLCGSSDNWVSVAKAVSTKYTVFLPDLRNHGRSPHSDIHNYEALSNDIYELLEELTTGKFFLAGHSMGGKTALFFATKWPEKLLGLIIADISPFQARISGSAKDSRHREMLNIIAETDLSAISSRDQAVSILSDKIKQERILGLILKNLQRMPDGKFTWKINASSLLLNLDNIMGGLARPENNQMTVTGFPVVFLKGEKSDYLQDDDWIDTLRIFPAAKLKVIKDAGHWLHVDNPDAVISEFLALSDHRT